MVTAIPVVNAASTTRYFSAPPVLFEAATMERAAQTVGQRIPGPAPSLGHSQRPRVTVSVDLSASGPADFNSGSPDGLGSPEVGRCYLRARVPLDGARPTLSHPLWTFAPTHGR